MQKTILVVALLFAFIQAGAQNLWLIDSPNLHCTDSIIYFIPEQPEPEGGFPALFLLHGWSGDYSNWSTKMDLQAVSNRFGFVIICPDGFYNGWYVNDSRSEGMQWRSFFNEELYPQAREKFGFTEQGCFVSGLSMGGHGAVNLYIDHPERFRAAGSMSGVLNLQRTSLRSKWLGQILGEYSPENPRFYTESALNRVDLLLDSPKEHLIVISCGYDDPYALCSTEFAQKCKEIKIPYILQLSPGTHSWKFWEYALNQHLFIFRNLVDGGPQGY